MNIETKDWLSIIPIIASAFFALVVNDLVHQLKEKRELINKKKRLRRNTVKEIEFNLSILDDLENQHKELEEYFIIGSWKNCFQHFKFTRVLFISFNEVLKEGFLYEFLNEKEDILKYDALISSYSSLMGEWCNSEVERYKKLLIENPNNQEIKQEAWEALKYRLAEIRKHKVYFKDLKSKLERF